MIILDAFGEFRSWHLWPEGAERGFPELAQPHWHNFHVRVQLLTQKDREVEFIAFGKCCAEILAVRLAECRSLSCESMAQYLLDRLEDRHHVVPLSVHVSEDGKGGAVAVSERRLADALAIF